METRLPITISIIAALCFLLAGVFIRHSFSYERFLELYNVGSYYYAKSEKTLENGSFPTIDSMDRAGASYKENAPPFLAYSTVLLYKTFSRFYPPLDFITFAKWFPIIIYILWGISGFFIIFSLGKSYLLAASFVFLLSFIPSAVELTRFSGYFEEVLGVWLFFLLLWAVARLGGNWYWILLSIFLLTLLAFTWQQFPIFYAGALAILFVELLLRRAGWRSFTIHLLLALAVPILVGEVISRFFLGIDYSPFSMLRELWIGFQNQKDPALSWVMRRADWNGLNLHGFIKSFGMLGAVLITVGLLGLLKESWQKRRERILLIFGVLGVALPFLLMKERFLALGLLLYPATWGIWYLMKPPFPQETLRRLKSFYQKAAAVLKRKMAVSLTAALTIILVTVSVIYSITISGKNDIPYPSVIIGGVPTVWELGKKYTLSVTLQNNGGDSLKEKRAFGGLHIEVENAKVKPLRATSPFTDASIKMKEYAEWGNVEFFESKLGRLKNGEYGKVTLAVTPYWLPVHIYYRGWLPGYCDKKDRKAVIKELLPSWQDPSSNWRSENCIKRSPANNETEWPFCKVAVMAARREPIPYRCFVVE